jgi:hypothetical protein
MSGMKIYFGLSCIFLLPASITGCQSSRTNPAFSPAAFVGAETATLRLETAVNGSTYFSVFRLEKCPKATLEELGYVSDASVKADITIPAGAKFHLVVRDDKCSDSGSFVPIKDVMYIASFSYLPGNSCRVKVLKASTTQAAESAEPTFSNFTRINVYGLTPSMMCPRMAK